MNANSRIDILEGKIKPDQIPDLIEPKIID
jgi:hypothetical protein